MLRLLLAVSIALTVAGCASSQTYSADDVVEAFSRSGYTLQEIRLSSGAAVPGGSAFAPRDGAPFAVVVAKDSDAETLWKSYVAAGPDDDSFDARRANVVATSDGGLSDASRRRLRSALARLPDRGDTVTVLTQRP